MVQAGPFGRKIRSGMAFSLRWMAGLTAGQAFLAIWRAETLVWSGFEDSQLTLATEAIDKLFNKIFNDHDKGSRE
jgi:hypothetical protein